MDEEIKSKYGLSVFIRKGQIITVFIDSRTPVAI